MSDTLLSVEEYLRSSYEGDRDYVDGELHERNWGEMRHGMVQSAVAVALSRYDKTSGFISLISVRFQTSPSRIRVPDVCAVSELGLGNDILRTPPALCVEIVSPQDTFTRLVRKLYDSIDAGVPHLWVLDPWSRYVWTMDHSKALTLVQNGELSLPGAGLRIPIAEVFEELDEAAASIRAWERANPWVPGSLD